MNPSARIGVGESETEALEEDDDVIFDEEDRANVVRVCATLDQVIERANTLCDKLDASKSHEIVGEARNS